RRSFRFIWNIVLATHALLMYEPAAGRIGMMTAAGDSSSMGDAGCACSNITGCAGTGAVWLSAVVPLTSSFTVAALSLFSSVLFAEAVASPPTSTLYMGAVVSLAASTLWTRRAPGVVLSD